MEGEKQLFYYATFHFLSQNITIRETLRSDETGSEPPARPSTVTLYPNPETCDKMTLNDDHSYLSSWQEWIFM